MENQHQPKISIPEAVLLTEVFVLFDAIEIVLNLFGLDDFFLLDIIRFPFSQLYMYFKGLKGTTMLIGNILETIPYVGALPNATIVWLIVVWLDRNPQIAEKVQTATKIAKPATVK
jgi:hypothetical protein